MLISIHGSKTATMKKLILFIGMFVMLLSLSTRPIVLSPVSDDTSPPPEITAANTQFQFDQFVIAANDEAIPAPLLSWGYNNEMCHFERTAPTSYPTRIQYFFGPGDRLASAMLGGQRVLSNNDDNAFTNLYFAATELKNFLGPGDMPASGYLTGHNYEGENNEEMCLGTATELKNFLGPGDMCVLGSAEQNLYEITLSNNRGTCDNDVNVIRTPTGVTYRTGPGDHCRLTI